MTVGIKSIHRASDPVLLCAFKGGRIPKDAGVHTVFHRFFSCALASKGWGSACVVKPRDRTSQ